MSQRRIDRRSALQMMGSAGIAAALTIPSGRGVAAGHERLYLLDQSLGESDRGIAQRALGDGHILPLEPDLVVQWRRGLDEQVIAAGNAVAFVRWDKAFVLTGLAREHGLRTHQRRIGRAMFRVEIG